MALFGSKVSERLSYSRKELPGSNDNLTNIIPVVLALANRTVGRVARTNFFEVMFRVIYWAVHVSSSEKIPAPLPQDGSSSMLQTNETNLRKNALNKSILVQDCTNQWRAVVTKQIFGLRQIVNLIFWLLSSSDPDRLFGLLHARRSSSLFERNEFLIATPPPKICACAVD